MVVWSEWFDGVIDCVVDWLIDRWLISRFKKKKHFWLSEWLTDDRVSERLTGRSRDDKRMKWYMAVFIDQLRIDITERWRVTWNHVLTDWSQTRPLRWLVSSLVHKFPHSRRRLKTGLCLGVKVWSHLLVTDYTDKTCLGEKHWPFLLVTHYTDGSRPQTGHVSLLQLTQRKCAWE